MPDVRGKAWLAWAAIALLLCLLALARPIDHDESQYVAAAVLTAHGYLPYRDYAYLQTPLQPFLFAPVVLAAGTWAWPALRIANALLGAATLGFTWRAARRLAPPRIAVAATALFGCCDILLFAIGTARNDALPAACLAAAVWLAIRAEEKGATRASAVLTGLLLSAATAAKISYALPAIAYGGWTIFHRHHRPLRVAIGALPVAAFVAWTAAIAPAGFLFGVIQFPARAPAEFYAARPWKLSGAAKLIDLLKFLALGPALLALGIAWRPRPAMLAWLTAAGLVAALLPTPTWRQYLLPMLPPLFVMLAWHWSRHPPTRTVQALAIILALIGLAPTALSLTSRSPGMPTALAQGRAIRIAMDGAGVTGPVATLSPQFLPASGRIPDPRFATGPFFFRNRTLSVDETALHLISRRFLPCAPLGAILVGGEGDWTSGDPSLDRALEAVAITRGDRQIPVPGTPFRLYVR